MDRRASEPKPTEYTSHVRFMYHVDNRFIFVVLGEEKVHQVGVECFRTKTKLINHHTRHHKVGTETGFQKVSRCPRSVSLGRKYPIPVSKMKYELFRKSFRRPKSDQEIRLIYR